MSITAMNYVIRLKIGNMTAKFVLERLADRADERFSCYPGVALIAAELEVSERTVQRGLEHLRDLRLLSDRARYRANGSQTVSRYILHGPWDDYAGTGVPFPEIVLPKKAREELWAQEPAEGEFRDGTAAAVALKGDQEAAEAAAKRAAEAAARAAAAAESKSERGRKAAVARSEKIAAEAGTKDIPADGDGVTAVSPPPVTAVSPPPVSLMSPLEPSVRTTTESAPLTARSAGAVRSTTDVSSAREGESGCAAAGRTEAAEGVKPAVPAPRASNGGGVAGDATPQGGRQNGPVLTPEETAAVHAVEAVLPAALLAVLPYRHIPGRCRPAVLAALESRTVEQLAARAARRWLGWGYAEAHDAGELRSPIGVAVELIAPGLYCPDLSCEDGEMIDTRVACRACAERRRERRAARRAGETVPTGRTGAGRAPLPECADCRAPFAHMVPEDGVCAACRTEAAAEEAEIAARMQAIADEWDREAADRAAAEEADRAEAERHAQAQAAEDARRRAQAAADAEETARLRAWFAEQHPELVMPAQPPTAPF
ncbi:helix-turn-helix domain-containing protein [Embleya sp. NPDC059237]|uniref:helix-turn-helix domain-containing protein n=1 Tax=Embleya sp. NPDC059237 TaxID=3346784 RepID=UPI00367D2391